MPYICMKIINNRRCGGEVHNRECEKCGCYGGDREWFPVCGLIPYEPIKEIDPDYIEQIDLENEFLMLNKPRGIGMIDHRNNWIPEECQ